MKAAQTENTPVIIGRLGAPYGVKGMLKLQSFLEASDSICAFDSFLIKKGNNDWKTIQVVNARRHGKAFIAQLQGIEDRDQAALLTNSDVAVMRDEFPKLLAGEYYWFELLQLEVFTKEQKRLGVVTDIFNNGATDILVVAEQDKEYLIPYVLDQYVLKVDLAAKKILVDWQDLAD